MAGRSRCNGRANGKAGKIQRRSRKLSPDDVRLVRELYAAHTEAVAQKVRIDSMLLELMSERDRWIEEAARTSPRAIAAKFSCSTTAIQYACRPRSSHIV